MPLFTALLADLTGSVGLFSQLEERDALAVQACYLEVMQRAVEQHGGRVEHAFGDELYAVFDQALAACRAACEIQQAVTRLPALDGLSLAVRIGLQIGQAQSNSIDEYESIKQLAARLAMQAGPGRILAGTEIQLAVGTLPASCGTLAHAAGQTSAYELRWEPPTVPSSTRRGTVVGLGKALHLHYRGESLMVDAGQPTLTLGRDRSNSVYVHHRKASRAHATVLWQNGDFIFRDSSTNGSYLTQEGLPEVLVRKQDVVLKGKGQVAFGTPADEIESDIAEFEII